MASAKAKTSSKHASSVPSKRLGMGAFVCTTSRNQGRRAHRRDPRGNVRAGALWPFAA
eukprot:CAMPEP_0206135212 /NCGR_PEP_ID=MMETSP1473-20131121/547_1 /ASSEMBLY_ACC=CAM_ASM_001109 /TAXON_ID=1461547 /ORGANISM="Stichococcus sp, Strain RCC1054" /LENGTH=57 /DNA_ID=CAMNT_0053526985 /DNA_START=166 /DNA_END=339 /DNA_ORIENTATION=+